MSTNSEFNDFFVRAIIGNSLRKSFTHEFKKCSYFKPTFCDHCHEMLYGVARQGWRCRACGINAHTSCKSHLEAKCRVLNEAAVPIQLGDRRFVLSELPATIIDITPPGSEGKEFTQIVESYSHQEAPSQEVASENQSELGERFIRHIGNDSSHEFGKCTFFKPTFCKICRKMLYGITKQGWHCRGCGVNTHTRCKDLVAAKCRVFKEAPATIRLGDRQFVLAEVN